MEYNIALMALMNLAAGCQHPSVLCVVMTTLAVCRRVGYVMGPQTALMRQMKKTVVSQCRKDRYLRRNNWFLDYWFSRQVVARINRTFFEIHLKLLG